MKHFEAPIFIGLNNYMKDSTIESLNKEITKFIQGIAKYENAFAEEAPGIWMGILASISTLSKATVFLDSVRKNEMKADLDFYNQMREANGLSPTGVLPPNMLKDRDVDSGKYRSPWSLPQSAYGTEEDNPSHNSSPHSQEKA